MPSDNVKAFMKKVREDRELQAKFRSVDQNPKANWKERMAKLIEIASSAGYEFTPQDYADEKLKTIEQKGQVSHAKPLGNKSVPPQTDRLWGICTLCQTSEENTTGGCINCDTYCQNNPQHPPKSKSSEKTNTAKEERGCWYCEIASENTTGQCWVCDTTCQVHGAKV